MDGKVIIGTELDTKQLEKQLKQQEKELQKYEQEAEKLTKLKVSIDTNSTKKAIDDLNIKFKEARQKYKDILASGETGIGIGKQKDLVDDLKFKLDETKAKYREQLGEVTKINNQLNKNATAQGVIKNKIQETTGALKGQQFIGNMKDKLKDIGNGVEGVVRKVGKWALALFGIRAMYSFIRNSINTITQNDAQLKADIDYMKNALAYTLEPVIRQIVGWAQQLMQYLGYIIYKWTGKNIFENANKSLKSATGEAKKLKKELMGFDEVNMLSDTSSGGGGATTPSFDLSKTLDESAVPNWVKWIADNKKVIEELGLTALGIFGAGTIASWIQNIGGFLGSSQLGLLGTKLGALSLIAGGIIITAICAKKVWDDTQQLKEDLDTIAGSIQKGTDKWLEQEPAIDQVYSTLAVRQNATNDLIKEYASWFWKVFGVSDKILKNLVEGVKGEKKLVDYAIDHYDYDKHDEKEKQRLIDKIQTQIEKNNDVAKILKEQGKSTKEIDDMNKELAGYLWSVRNNTKYTKDATNEWYTETDKVRTSYDGVVELLDTIDGKDLKDKQVKVTTDTTNYDNELNKIKTSNNEAKVKIKPDTTNFLTNLKTSLSSAFGNLTTAGKSTASSIAKLFGIKLATGGIVNMPGRGVPVGGAVAGESGREGVIPLTDPQAMAQLGEEIGRWVNIGIQNQMVVDGRVLASATNNRINKESFLMNR